MTRLLATELVAGFTSRTDFSLLYFLLMNIFAIAGGYRLAAALFPGIRFTGVRPAAAAILSYASIVLIGTVAGAISILNVESLVIAASGFFLAACILSPFLSKLRGAVTVGAASETGTDEEMNVISIALFFVAGAAAFFIFIWGILSPPPPWDAFVYHLPFAATWLQDGHISLVTVPFGDQAGTYFPSNTEIYQIWLMAPLKSEMITNAGQFPFYCLTVYLVYRIAREGGIGRNAAALSGALCFFLPGMMHQAVSSEVDIVFAALFLASAFFLIVGNRLDGDPVCACISGLSAGLFAGTKYIGLTFFPIIALPAIFIYFRKRKFGSIFIFLASSFVCCGYWYIRNWAVTGDPVFPLTLKIFGMEIFSGGYPRSSMMYAVFHAKSVWQWLTAMETTTGGPLGILLAAGMVFGPIAVFIEKRAAPKAAALFVCAAAPTVIAIFAFLIPYNLESRFTYAAWALAAVSLGFLLDSGSKPVRFVAIGSVTTCILLSIYFNGFLLNLVGIMSDIFFSSDFTAGGNGADAAGTAEILRPGTALLSVCAICAATAIVFRSRKHIGPVFRRSVFIVFLAISVLSFVSAIAVALPAYRQYRLLYHPDFLLGRAWQFLDVYQTRRGPAAANIAFTGTDLCFGLFGASLQNRVYSVPVNNHPEWKFHNCARNLKSSGEYEIPETDRIDFCRHNPDAGAWMSNLAGKRTDFVLISRLHQNDLPHLAHDADGFPIELSWAESNPGLFSLIYANSQVRIYKMNHSK